MNYALYVSRDAPKRAAEILDAMTPDDLAAAVPEELVESLRAQLEIAEPAFPIESTPATTRRLLTPGDVESPIVVRITNLPGSAADRFWVDPHVMLAIVAASCGSPQILAVNHRHRPVRSLEVIEQPCVDADPARLAVPAAVRLERRTVGIEAAPAGAAEMVGNFLGVQR